ncbi:hypothetical protein TNCV_493461 [Trichonephila clavipes]|nr:hypothetical protein TNCV_493461 [Trichonephila clavipes]
MLHYFNQSESSSDKVLKEKGESWFIVMGGRRSLRIATVVFTSALLLFTTNGICDESQFCISGNQSSAYVRRRTHEEFSSQCLKPTVKYPTKVKVWGCMSSHGVGRLHIVSGTVKAMDYSEILQNKLLPIARDLFGNQS